MTAGGRITVGISTRQRPESLQRALASLAVAEGLIARVIVVDDGSDPPLSATLGASAGPEVPPIHLLREEVARGVAGARNRIAREAGTPYLLFLDDDAVLLTADALRQALAVLDADPSVAAIAFSQADADGNPHGAQPAAVDHPARVQTFIGFAHLLRRDTLLRVGGFREVLRINGEERELSLRLLDAGFSVVYLPDARVGHLPDQAGRDVRAFVRIIVRNDVLGAMLNEPLPMAAASVPIRLRRYFAMRRGWSVDDPGGFGHVLRSVAAALPTVIRERHAVRWSTLREWRRLAVPQPYHPPPAP